MTRDEFDNRIGRLDRCLSEFLDLFSVVLDEPDRQTLKHHADDLIGVGGAMLNKLGKSQRVTPTHAENCAIYLPLERSCDCGAAWQPKRP